MAKTFHRSSGSAESTSVELMEGVKARDEDACVRFVDLYGPLIYHWCRHGGLRAEDASDLVQEVFQSAISSIEHFRKERPEDTFRGWLWTITRNKLRDRARKLAGRAKAIGGTDAQRQFLQVPDREPAETFGQSKSSGSTRLAKRVLDQVRDQFEDRTWRAFHMATFEDRSSSEIGVELGMTANAVRLAKARVLRRLRREFGDLIG